MLKYILFFILSLIPTTFYGNDYSVGIVIFSADWCPPCRQMRREVWSHPEIKKLIKDNNIKIYDVNIDTNVKLSNLYNVNAVPTVIIGTLEPENKFKIISKITAFQNVETLKHNITKVLNFLKERAVNG